MHFGTARKIARRFVIIDNQFLLYRNVRSSKHADIQAGDKN